MHSQGSMYSESKLDIANGFTVLCYARRVLNFRRHLISISWENTWEKLHWGSNTLMVWVRSPWICKANWTSPVDSQCISMQRRALNFWACLICFLGKYLDKSHWGVNLVRVRVRSLKIWIAEWRSLVDLQHIGILRRAWTFLTCLIYISWENIWENPIRW